MEATTAQASGPAASDWAALERRLSAAEDRLAILDLEGEYARAWDCGDAAGWAAAFTPDGSFEMVAVGNQAARTMRGTAALAAFCDEVGGFYRGLHFLGLPRVVLDGETARAQIHFQWVGVFRPGGVWSGERHAKGFYEVTYRKQGGTWRIARRIEKVVSGGQIESYDPFVNVDLTAPSPEPASG